MKKFLLALFFAFTASQVLIALPSQLPRIEPATGDHGVFSVQDQTSGSQDPNRAIAFDNFSLSSGYTATGIDWVGIYAEPLADDPSDTDFIVQIWGDSGGVPDLGSGAKHTFQFEGGPDAGTAGADLFVNHNGDVSSATDTSVGGGPGFVYSGAISPTPIAAGDHWISIIADQRFDSAAPVVDPEWQWHIGTGPGDGFFARDVLLDADGTPEYGIHQHHKDLAFSIRGIIPEPSGMLLALIGLVFVGLLRRNRS